METCKCKRYTSIQSYSCRPKPQSSHCRRRRCPRGFPPRPRRGVGCVMSRTPSRTSPAPSFAHNTSVLLASAVRRRHQVQYHLGLRRQLSFYDQPCILRALLPGPSPVRRETLTPVRAIITTERNTPFSRRRETINAVLQFPESVYPCLPRPSVARLSEA